MLVHAGFGRAVVPSGFGQEIGHDRWCAEERPSFSTEVNDEGSALAQPVDGLTDETMADGEEPPVGQAFRYLVRAANSCGGSWGASLDGTPRSVSACP